MSTPEDPHAALPGEPSPSSPDVGVAAVVVEPSRGASAGRLGRRAVAASA
jgi:hypothetical protein